MNKFLLLCCFVGIVNSSSLELADYCFIKNDKYLYLQIQNTPIEIKTEQTDSLECDGQFSIERKDTFNLHKNLSASYKTYYASGCSGFGGCLDCHLLDSNISSVPCLIKEKIAPIKSPNKFSINKTDLEKPISNFQMENLFNKRFNVNWEVKVECPAHNNIIYSGTYFIRITGECE